MVKKIGRDLILFWMVMLLVLTVSSFTVANAEMMTGVPKDDTGKEVLGMWSIDEYDNITARCPSGWSCEVQCEEITAQGGFYFQELVSHEGVKYHQMILAKYDDNEDPDTNPDFDGIGTVDTMTNAKFSQEYFVVWWGMYYWEDRPLVFDQHNHTEGIDLASGESLNFNAEYLVLSETQHFPGPGLTAQGDTFMNLAHWINAEKVDAGVTTYFNDFFHFDRDPARAVQKIVTMAMDVRVDDGDPVAAMSDGFYNALYQRLEYTDLEAAPSFKTFQHVQRNYEAGYTEEVTIVKGPGTATNIDIFQVVDLLEGAGPVFDNLETFDYRVRDVPDTDEGWAALGLTPAQISALTLPATLTLPDGSIVKYYENDRVAQLAIGMNMTDAGAGMNQKTGIMNFENTVSDIGGSPGSQLEKYTNFVDIPPQTWVDGGPPASTQQLPGASADIIFQKLDRSSIFSTEVYIPDPPTYSTFRAFIDTEP